MKQISMPPLDLSLSPSAPANAGGFQEKSFNREAFDRRESSRAFTQAFIRSPSRHLLKKCINHGLSSSGLGDELTIYSVKKV